MGALLYIQASEDQMRALLGMMLMVPLMVGCRGVENEGSGKRAVQASRRRERP